MELNESQKKKKKRKQNPQFLFVQELNEEKNLMLNRVFFGDEVKPRYRSNAESF